MGAVFQSTTFYPSDETVLRLNFSEHQHSLLDNYGHDAYAGHMGIVRGLSIQNKTFKTEGEAEEYVSKNASKWDSAIAVKVGDFSKVFPSTAKEKKEEQKLLELSNKFTNWDANLIQRVKSSKSLQRSCKKCNSKISVKYIKGLTCPVCGDYHFVSTESDKKTLALVSKSLKEQESKVNKLKEKYKEQYKTTFWFVGAWCPE